MTGRYKAGDFVIFESEQRTGRCDADGKSIYIRGRSYGIINSVNTIKSYDKKEAFYKIDGHEVQEQDIKSKVVVE